MVHLLQQHDQMGNQSSVTDYSAHTPGSGTWTASTSTSYTYDPITGQIASETSPSGTIHYVYDPTTGEHIETWTGTTQASANDDTLYAYNALGELVSVTTVREDGYAAPLVNGAYPVTTYTYDPDGNLLTETLPNGAVTTYTYDSNNRLTLEVTKDSSNNVLASYQYTLLSDGLIGTDVEQVVQPSPNSMAKDTVTYTYDADGHLTGESHDVGSNGADGNDWSQVYIYDLNGNRLETDKSFGGGVFTETAAFVYNADNQLTEQDGWVLGFEGPDVTEFSYDANGNLIEEDVNPDGDGKGSVPASTTTYTYDLRGRQIEEYTPANEAAGTSAVTTYSVYDTSGDRIMEGSSYFLIDDNNLTGYSQVLEERDGSFTATLARSYVLGLDVVGQTIGNPTTANAVEYILSDGNHSTRQLVNSSGTVQSDWSYDSFGNITGGYNQAIYTGGGRGQPLTYLGPTSDVGFQGGYLNTDGTVLMGIAGGRNYNPVTGRFNDIDPTSNSFGPGDLNNSNFYLLVNDDPRNGRDPTGHMSEAELATVAAITGTLAAMSFYNIANSALHSSLSFAQGNYSQGAAYLRSELVGLLSLSFGGGTIRPQPLMQAQSVVQMSQISISGAASLAEQYLALFSSAVGSFGGQSYVSRPGASEQDVKDSQGNTVRVIGQSGSSSTTPGHDDAIDSIVQSELGKPGRLLIFMQRSLGTATGRSIASRLIPDVTVIRLDENGQLKIDAYEVRSQSQNPTDLLNKLAYIKSLIPSSMQGNFVLENPSQ